MTTASHRLLDASLPPEAAALLAAAPRVTVAGSTAELIELAVRDAVHGVQEVAYDLPGQGRVVEARVCRTRNGICANYVDPYMRRRDPDCMVIADARPTDKPTYQARFGEPFGPVREATFDWLASQPLAAFPFYAGLPSRGTQALAIVPENAGFY